jgi:tetratricopeptide (TPR) repeat protein
MSLALAPLLLASACKDAMRATAPDAPAAAPDAPDTEPDAPVAEPDAPPTDPSPPASTTPTVASATLDELQRLYKEAEADPTRLETLKEQILRYLAEHPDEPTALTLLSQVHLEQGRLDESLATAEHCVAIAAETAACWLTLAVISETKGVKARALEGYRRYLELAPSGRYAPDVRKALARLGASAP